MSVHLQNLVRALALTGAVLGLTSAAVLAQKINRSWSGIGVKGYDVVAYFTDHMPVKGDAAFEHVHEGVTYRFASAAHRDAFVKEPGRYQPQYGGFCAYAVSRNYTADIDPTAWRIVDGRLYLNYNAGAQAKWAEDVPGNIRKADANWPALSQR